LSVYAVVKYKDWDGKWRSACEEDKALALIQAITSSVPPAQQWEWLRDKLAVHCLCEARKQSTNSERADRWIERYRAIREIS